MRSPRRWWWLIPLVALLCSLVMGGIFALRAAGLAKDGALAALDGAGLGAVEYVGIEGLDGIGNDGLNVILEGPASAETAAVEAVQARAEVDRVIYRVSEDDQAEVEQEPVDEPEPAEDTEDPAPAVDLDPALVLGTLTATGINLEGVVADDATREALISSAVQEYGAANVTHRITVDPENVGGDGGSLTLNGEALSASVRSDWLAQGTAVATAANLELIDEITVKPVEQSLNELFALEPIEFDVNQATIRPRSIATLDAAAEMINANPEVGALRVVGHTDSDGSAELNRSLSQARADAVVAYLVEQGGVDADRLEAEGRGESQLLVDPETSPEDKQRNRRIEWELVS